MSERIVAVHSAAELNAVITSFSGDVTVKLASGDYGNITIANKHSGKLKLMSEDAEAPAKLSLFIWKSENIFVEGLQFRPPGTQWSSGLLVRDSSNISIVENLFTGVDPTFRDEAYGLRVRDSADILIQGNEFTEIKGGVLIGESRSIKLLDNYVHDVRSEGFNLAGVRDVEIARNFGTDFHNVAPHHPDFIQFWTRATKSESENIYIHDNTFLQGEGAPAQGIFLGNEDHIYYKNVRIEDNYIYSNMPNGIRVTEADGLVIKGNIAVGLPSAIHVVSMWAFNSRDVLLEGNTANNFGWNGSVDVSQHDNTRIVKGEFVPNDVNSVGPGALEQPEEPPPLGQGYPRPGSSPPYQSPGATTQSLTQFVMDTVAEAPPYTPTQQTAVAQIAMTLEEQQPTGQFHQTVGPAAASPVWAADHLF